jgi:hypothetical protein
MTAGAQTLTGITTFSNTTAATSSITGAIITSGGLGISKNIWVGAAFSATNTTVAGSILNIPAFTYTSSTATPTNVNVAAIQQVTISNATAIANAASLYVANAPAVSGGGSITNPYAIQVAAGKTYIGGALQIPTGASNGFLLTSDTSGNATWAEATPSVITYFSALANGSTSTNSNNPVNIANMTLTPNIAGTYLVTFTTTARTSNSGRNMYFELTRNGTIVTNIRTLMRSATANFDTTVHLEAFVSFNGTSDTITARFNVSNNTLTCTDYRMLNAIRLTT